MAFAPYSEWRKAMRCTEKNGYSSQVKGLLLMKSTGIPPGLRVDRSDGWLAALLADSHILANSKGQYLQTLHSEKVDPGQAATGRRFRFEGVYRHDGVLLPDFLRPGSSEWDLMAYAATSLAMQDPWSVVARKIAVVEDEEPSGEGRKRRAAPAAGPAKKTKKEEETRLNRWDLLPKEDAVWMRGLLEVPGASFLTVLPCIKDEKIMPMEVVNLVQSGRGEILFYANVVHVVLCPRHLVNGNAIHRHHNDCAVAICVSDKEGPPRLFVRCFSEKCLHLSRKSSHRQIPLKWEEYTQSHFTRYNRLLLGERRKQREIDPVGSGDT